MKLDRLILINWGQLPPGDYSLGDKTLLTGETGSGKSTMLDGLQAIMTAAFKGVVNFNPGQDETNQGPKRGKTRRTVESYVVGAEYSKFSRPDGAHGYLAAVFRPDPGEEGCKPFTAVVAASARVEGAVSNRQAKLEQFSLFIVDDATLTSTDFLPDAEKGECVAVESAGRTLRSKYPRVIEFHDKKADYLCALYGRFRGKQSVPREEALQAAKAWVQSIAYRPMGSVHELVRDEILAFDQTQLQEEIRGISSIMRQVRELRQKGEQLHKNVHKLETLETTLRETAGAHEKHLIEELYVANYRVSEDTINAERTTKRITVNQAEIQRLEKAIQSQENPKAQLMQEQVQLAARLMGLPGQKDKAQYEQQIQSAVAEASKGAKNLITSLVAATVLDERAQQMLKVPRVADAPLVNAALDRVAKAYTQSKLSQLVKNKVEALALLSALENLSLDAIDVLCGRVDSAYSPTEVAGVADLYQSLVGPSASLMLELAAVGSKMENAVEDAESQVAELENRCKLLLSGSVAYPESVNVALRRIRERYPEAQPQVLCDLVEPVSPDWQPAIEGYMGNARFNLVVNPEWEAKVLDLVHQRGLDAKVVQGSLCLRKQKDQRLPPDSIVHELTTNSAIVQAYLVEQYGSVLKVATSEELRHISRGITKAGKASGSRTLFAVKHRELLFGKQARADQLVWASEQLNQAKDRLSEARDKLQGLSRIKALLAGVKEPVFETPGFAAYGAAIVGARQGLTTLDLSGSEELSEKLASVTERIGAIDRLVQGQREALTLRGADSKNLAAELKSVEEKRPANLASLERCIRSVQALTAHNPELSYPDIAKVIEARLVDEARNPSQVAAHVQALQHKPALALSEAREALADFNAQCANEERFVDALPFTRDSESFEPCYVKVCALLKAVTARVTNYKAVQIYNNQLELERAVASFNDVFTKSFCVQIKSRVDDGIRTLRQLNNELRNLKFGQDRFSIDWSRWEPEMQEYLDFFEAVTRLTESSESLDLFANTELSAKHLEIRDHLVKLLLSENAEHGMRELTRIADYRNYRRYDIINESDSGGMVRVSEWGTGSGGQMETPTYLVRSAVVTNKLRMFERGPSLKLLVNDESFSKMDESRARSVIDYLSTSLNLQLISAMPTMKSGALKDEFTREYSFTRMTPVDNGELNFVTEVDERVFKADRMRELWARQRQQAREAAKQLFDEQEPPEVEQSEAA